MTTTLPLLIEFTPDELLVLTAVLERVKDDAGEHAERHPDFMSALEKISDRTLDAHRPEWMDAELAAVAPRVASGEITREQAHELIADSISEKHPEHHRAIARQFAVKALTEAMLFDLDDDDPGSGTD